MRADLFALGVIAYELLTSRPLFQGTDDMDTLYRVKNMPILPPSRINPQVPPEIESIIMTALERDPDKRWQRATAMRQAMTTETQRLGLVAHNGQVEEWIASAFARQFNEESEPSIVISRHTVELAHGTVPDEFREHTNDNAKTIIRPSGSQPLQAQQDNETTLTDEEPVRSEFAVATVIEQPSDSLLKQSATDWNSPSVVETVHDRPRMQEWNTAETREVRQGSVERRGSSPHTIQRGSGSNPALRLDQGQPAARDSSPTLTRSERPSWPPASSPAPTRPTPRPAPEFPDVARPASPAARNTLLGQTGPLAVPPSGARTAPHAAQQSPGVPLSGSRTAPVLILDADAARTDVNVSASAVLQATDVSAVLADLDQRSSVGKPPNLQRRRGGGFLLAVLVLIAAGGAAAVVYFALPYLT